MKINKNPTHICADSICALVLFQHFGVPGSNSRLGGSPSPQVWTGAGHLVCLKLTILRKSVRDKGKPVTAGNKSLGGGYEMTPQGPFHLGKTAASRSTVESPMVCTGYRLVQFVPVRGEG